MYTYRNKAPPSKSVFSFPACRFRTQTRQRPWRILLSSTRSYLISQPSQNGTTFFRARDRNIAFPSYYGYVTDESRSEWFSPWEVQGQASYVLYLTSDDPHRLLSLKLAHSTTGWKCYTAEWTDPIMCHRGSSWWREGGSLPPDVCCARAVPSLNSFMYFVRWWILGSSRGDAFLQSYKDLPVYSSLRLTVRQSCLLHCAQVHLVEDERLTLVSYPNGDN